jgi:formylmethanofuran dehydrogenase subunit E
MTEFTVTPIGHVESTITETDDGTGATLRNYPATIVVNNKYLKGLTNFDERVGTGTDAFLDVVFYFDGINADEIELAGQSGEGLTPAGLGGVFTRRTPRRPNPIGLTTVRVLFREGRYIHVEGLDALDGTPVLDLKPYVDWIDQFK